MYLTSFKKGKKLKWQGHLLFDKKKQNRYIVFALKTIFRLVHNCYRNILLNSATATKMNRLNKLNCQLNAIS